MAGKIQRCFAHGILQIQARALRIQILENRQRSAERRATLGTLAADLQAAAVPSMSRDDRFDVYYFLGRALYETAQDAAAFDALRQAINQDPGTIKDASLWAKYYLGILYERRGEVKTARQLYHTLLRERNVDDLHQQIEQRLAQLR